MTEKTLSEQLKEVLTEREHKGYERLMTGFIIDCGNRYTKEQYEYIAAKVIFLRARNAREKASETIAKFSYFIRGEREIELFGKLLPEKGWRP